jgi:imidazolonepropionase-like amidohydrolase
MRLKVLVVAFCIAAPAFAQSESQDLGAARELFEKNLDAIRNRDRNAYLALYLNSEKLARSGPEGTAFGFESFAKGAGENWPDTFEGRDLQLVRVQPGVVYGTYRYRVRYGADESSGVSERIFLKTPAGWKIAATTAFEAPSGTPPPPVAIVGGTLLDGTGATPKPNATIVIRNGRVDCAGNCEVPAGVSVIDAKGTWITPGIIDAHVHFSQTGWADGRPDGIDVRDRFPYEKTIADLRAHPERFARSQLCSGVTAVFDVGGYPWTLELPEKMEKDTRSPHIAAAGPLLSTADHWLNLPAERQFMFLSDENAARTGTRYLAAQGADAVKLWYIVTPEKTAAALAPLVRAVADEAKKNNLPLIVHATGLDEAREAVRAGTHLLVHSVWDKPVDQDFIDLLKQNGTIYCPTITVLRGYFRLNESAVRDAPAQVDDPNGCIDAATRAKIAQTPSLTRADLESDDLKNREQAIAARELTMAENLKRVRDAGVTVAMGTDAGNPFTFHGPAVYAEMEAMQRAGLTPMQVLTDSTHGGAMAMGREKDLGTLEQGKIADLLILDADPSIDIANIRRIRQVMRGGVLRSIEELQAVASH